MNAVYRFRSWCGRELSLWLSMATAASAAMGFSVLLLHPTLADIRSLSLIGTTSLVLGIAYRWSPSVVQRIPVLAVITFVALGAVGAYVSGLAYTFTGFFTVIFCFLGLTRPRGTGVKLLPLAVPCWLLDSMPVSSATFAKLPVVIGCWVLVSELIARYRQQQDSVQTELERQLNHDGLTGLVSRRGLDDALAALGTGDVVVFLDLDHFKDINDRHGHAAGDEVLAQFGRAVSTVLRSADTAVRYGGEEILILLRQATRDDADSALGRLRDIWRALQPGITFSAGVATVADGHPSNALLRADEALYRAKAAGRNRWVWTDDQISARPDVAGGTAPVDLPVGLPAPRRESGWTSSVV